MREVVKFNGKPEVIALKYATGREGSNEHGPYWMYTTIDDRVVFAKPALNEKLQAINPKPGMPISVQLLKNNQWDVFPVVERPAAVNEPGIGPQTRSQQVAASPYQSPQQSNPTTAGKTREQLMNDLGNVLVHGEIPVNGQGWSALRMALFAAIDEAHAAEQYATGKGMSIRFSAEDIRTMANTTVIGMQQRQGGR